jgi:hypothetical protein
VGREAPSWLVLVCWCVGVEGGLESRWGWWWGRSVGSVEAPPASFCVWAGEAGTAPPWAWALDGGTWWKAGTSGALETAGRAGAAGTAGTAFSAGFPWL